MANEEKTFYPSSSITFSVIQREYEYELNRSIKLDNKINMTITICSVLFLFIFRFLNFKELFGATNNFINDSAMYFIKTICAFCYIGVFTMFIYCIIRLILLLRTKGYYHYNCNEIFDKNLNFEPKEITEVYIATKYWSSTCINNKTNEKRSKDYNHVLWVLCAMLILCIITVFIKVNILGLGV